MPLVFEKSSCGIYQIVNKSNGHRYFGSSINIKTRFNAHACLLRKNKHCNRHLQSAWNKYGESQFLFQVLEFVDSKNLINKEQEYLNLNPEYNICPFAGKTKLGTKLSKETIEKIKNSNLGKTRSFETKERISLASKGKKKTRSKKHQENLTKALTGLKRSSLICSKIKESHKFLSKAIYGIHTISGDIITFESLSEARIAGFDSRTIVKVINKKENRTQHKQYVWHWKE